MLILYELYIWCYVTSYLVEWHIETGQSTGAPGLVHYQASGQLDTKLERDDVGYNLVWEMAVCDQLFLRLSGKKLPSFMNLEF